MIRLREGGSAFRTSRNSKLQIAVPPLARRAAVGKCPEVGSCDIYWASSFTVLTHWNRVVKPMCKHLPCTYFSCNLHLNNLFFLRSLTFLLSWWQLNSRTNFLQMCWSGCEKHSTFPFRHFNRKGNPFLSGGTLNTALKLFERTLLACLLN